jgi:DMSO/TMAO reductase YedYZ molybdopterin-dependent catalytic subunit
MVVAGVLAVGLAVLAWALASTLGTPDGMQEDVALGAVDGSEPTPTPMSTADTAGGSEWTVIVDGLVETPLNLSIDDIVAMPSSTVHGVLICVGLPTSPVAEGYWTGVRLGFILNQAGASPEAVKVAFHADDGFTTDLPVATAMRDDIILAYEKDGEPLAENLRLVVPCKWGYKWIRDPARIELVDSDFLGHYESMGYSDEADIPDDIDCD